MWSILGYSAISGCRLIMTLVSFDMAGSRDSESMQGMVLTVALGKLIVTPTAVLASSTAVDNNLT
jgi:hypothetical protein